MGALLTRFGAAGVRFELSERGRLDAIGSLTDEMRSLIRQNKPAIVAEILAANEPDARDDDRRACNQCKALADRGQCMAAYAGEQLGFTTPQVYHPVATLLQHCAAFRPFPNDPDSRLGSERWASLSLKSRP